MSIEPHTSIALWTHPRAMSTALERYFIERQDVTVFHEPLSYVFMANGARNSLPHAALEPDHPTDYAGVRDMMEAAREHGPVFHKDMCYHATLQLLQDRAYLASQTHIFLIRNPEDSVLSHATVHPDVALETLGYAEMPLIYERAFEATGIRPLVIDAADLEHDSDRVLANICKTAGLSFDQTAASWSTGMPEQWTAWSSWHTEAANRRSIGAPARKYSVSVQTHPHLKGFIDYCRPFYQYLRDRRPQAPSAAVA